VKRLLNRTNSPESFSPYSSTTSNLLLFMVVYPVKRLVLSSCNLPEFLQKEIIHLKY